MRNTGIEWTHRRDAEGRALSKGHTWNAIRGCTRVDAGCVNCYAEIIAARFSGPGLPYEGLAVKSPGGARWTGRIMCVEHHLHDPLRWQKPAFIFVNSMSDIGHPNVPEDYFWRMFGVMALAVDHIHQALTKRPGRVADLLSSPGAEERVRQSAVAEWHRYWNGDMLALNPLEGDQRRLPHIRKDKRDEELARRLARFTWPLSNVAIGISASDQPTFDRKVVDFLRIPNAWPWISAEPLLGALDVSAAMEPPCRRCQGTMSVPADPYPGGKACPRCLDYQGVDPVRLKWLVTGGESGQEARPTHPDNFRSLRDQASAAGIPFFFKQWGGFLPAEDALRLELWGAHEYVDHQMMFRVTKKAAGNTLDGRQHLEYPAAWNTAPPRKTRWEEAPEYAQLAMEVA